MTAEPALKLVETNDVETKALSYVSQAKAVTVVDSESYRMAGELWKAGREVMKAIDEGYDSIIANFHKGHKDAVAKKKSYYDPVESATRYLKSIMSEYDLMEERKRKAEQDRLEAIARKEEEERRILEAIAAEEAMKARGATKEEVAQETAAILETPVTVAPVVIPKATPKLAGGPVFQKRWDFEVVNASLIPRQYLSVDLVKIRQVVTALKGQANIPGVKTFEKRV